MRIATKAAMLFTAAVMLVLPFRVAHAQLVSVPALVHGQDEAMRVDNLAVTKGGGGSATNALTTIYDNASATPQFGIVSTDLTSIWGDELFTTAAGLVSTNKFTIFNAATNVGSLLTASVSVSFFDAVTSTPLGGYSGNINFGAGLPAGSFSVITATGLDPFLIVLNTTDIVVTQQVTATTGATNRLGIVSMGPILVGSSPTSMYINSSTIGGGVPGFYTSASGPANPGYLIAVNPPPVSTQSKTWSSLKKLYR
jgi:hypothetical protein